MNTLPMFSRIFCLAVLVAWFVTDLASARAAEAARPAGMIIATDYLPKGYAKDGSEFYREQLQQAIDATPEGGTLVFPPMTYKLDEVGLKIKSRMTLCLHGATFMFDDDCDIDGQAFLGEDVEDVTFAGGAIVGRNDKWELGVNIRGIGLVGASKNIRIRDMSFKNLSSNGIGIFATEDKPARDVWVTDCVVENCCNHYGDYLSGKGAGPEKGSKREDQGSVCFYYVNDWVVSGSRFEKSRSDGTHFFKSHRGQFVHNKVYEAKMGGYFIEDCSDVMCSDNVIRDNGSRGATIERGSRRCTLNANVIANSGREGLWAPDCVGLIVTGNFFDRNGRKPNGEKPEHVWNANITINKSKSKVDQWPLPADYVVANNIIVTTAEQVAAIRIDSDVASGIVIRDNVMRGENRQVLVQGSKPDSVIARGNE